MQLLMVCCVQLCAPYGLDTNGLDRACLDELEDAPHLGEDAPHFGEDAPIH